jgi:hypothetical protein
MSRVLVTVLVCVIGCASTGAKWKRADGSPFAEEQLQRDRLECFPEVGTQGLPSVTVKEARDCMRGRGWVPTSD